MHDQSQGQTLHVMCCIRYNVAYDRVRYHTTPSRLCLNVCMSYSADAAPAEKLAASIAVGLVNQKYSKPTAVALNSPNDWKWVDNIRVGAELRQQRWIKASVPDFIAYAVSVGAFVPQALCRVLHPLLMCDSLLQLPTHFVLTNFGYTN